MPQEMDNRPAAERKKESIETCRKRESKPKSVHKEQKRRNTKQEKRERYKNKSTKKCPVHDCTTLPSKEKKKVGEYNPKDARP